MYKLIKPNIEMFDKFRMFCDEIRASSNKHRNISDTSKILPAEFIKKSESKRRKTQTDYWFICDDDIVGIGSIKHFLTNEFSGCRGHISYIIRPSRQGFGWNEVLLQLLINESAKIGIKSAMIVCDYGNLTSEKAIKKAGGLCIGSENKKKKFIVDTGLDYEYWEDKNFKFKSINEIYGGFDVFLSLDRFIPEDVNRGWCPSYKYNIKLTDTFERVGYVDIRIGISEVVYYAGNIGYNINEKYRGNHYAGKGCLLIKKVAQEHNMNSLCITANPDNLPSRKTCVWIGGKLLEIVKIPKHSEQYSYGDRYKCRYMWDISK